MRSIFAVSLVFAASLAFAGCAAEAVQTDDEESVDESLEALSTYGQKLVGAWQIRAGYEFDFDHLVLRADGTYFWHHDIACFTTPCPTRDDGTFKVFKPAGGGVVGKLRLFSKSGGFKTYRVVIGGDGSIKLERFSSVAKFDRVPNWCQAAADCAGQTATVAVKCAAGYHAVDVCTETSSCSKTCEPDAKPKDCVVTGCSGQVCADDHVFTTCEYKPEYACYKTATCERNAATGKCGWRMTPELTKCLAGGGTGGTTCDYSDPNKKWVSKSASECAAILFMCEPGYESFFTDCGCGCQKL